MSVALARKDGLAKQHFSEDAANTPHVDSGGILSKLQQKLWGPIPPCYHQPSIVSPTFSNRMPSPGRWPVVVAGQAKISNLENALVVDEKVGGLHVSVQNVILVEVAQALEKLDHVALDLSLFEVDRRIIKEAGEIVIHVWRHHVHDGFLAFVGLSCGVFYSHVFQPQDVGV